MQKISTYERVETSPPSNLQTEPLYLRLTDEISQITKDDDDVLSTENGYLMRKSDKLSETKEKFTQLAE